MVAVSLSAAAEDMSWSRDELVQHFSAEVARPSAGFTALFGDLEYEMGGISYHLSTQIHQAGAPAER